MNKLFKYGIYFLVLCGLFSNSTANATVNLAGTRHFEITAENSIAAKAQAMAQARRILTTEILRRSVAPGENPEGALANMTEKDLTAIIASESIEKEKQSATSYVADITVYLDKSAVAKWHDKNKLKAVAGFDDEKMTAVQINLGSARLENWETFNAALREKGTQNRGGLRVVEISDGRIMAQVPTDKARAFENAVRETGVRVEKIGTTIVIAL